ncbi:unnamed protein product, partial [Mesorhabditis belari]|uniref:C-type lectin domain-containing protein n=1 Tax=Mesorhabditis belari TaxID=2138241 RepID=A0AAF3ELB1_9BILA
MMHDDAVHFCAKNFNGHLISIHNIYQSALLTSMTSQIYPWGFAFIGLSFNVTGEETWTWDDGSNLDYQRWGPGQPTKTCDYCIHAYMNESSGFWYNELGDSVFNQQSFFCLSPIEAPAKKLVSLQH